MAEGQPHPDRGSGLGDRAKHPIGEAIERGLQSSLLRGAEAPGAEPDAGVEVVTAGLHLDHEQRVVQLGEATPEVLREPGALDEEGPGTVELDQSPCRWAAVG